jgi:hypothetical protein
MITATLLFAGLTAVAADPAKLEVVNPRLTYGVPGPLRTDRFIRPGDRLMISFDIEGLKVGPDGKIKYAVGTEIADSAGKVIFKNPPRDLETINSLGGSRVPAFAQVDVGLDQAPGEYKLTLTIKDPSDGRTLTMSRDFTVQPKSFAIVRLTTSTDHEAQFPAAVYSPGQSMFVTFGLVGFARDKTEKMQPHLVSELRILDENGKATTEKPFVGELKENVSTAALGVPVQFLVSINRPGKFTVELTAHDRIAGTKSTLTFPLVVVEPR